MPRTFGSLSAYEPGLMDQARWWLQDKLTPVMGGDARRAGDFVQNKVMPTAEYLPGVGDAMAAGEAVDYFKQGQPIFGTLAAAGAAAGLVPGVGDAVQKGVKKGIRAYHGSPHDFDKFSLDKIGTGEGAQAYGHGLYFAEQEDVARQYREQLTAQAGVGGRGAITTYLRDGVELPASQKAEIDIAQTMQEFGLDPSTEEGARWLRSEIGARNMSAPRDIDEQLVREIYASGPIEKNRQYGRMYEVNINADPNDFLDWDKPYSEQPEQVRAYIDNALANDEVFQAWKKNGAIDRINGNLIYDRLAGPQGMTRGNVQGRNAASDAARQAGIPGIKYLDAGSRPPVYGPAVKSMIDEFGSKEKALEVAQQRLKNATSPRDQIKAQEVVDALSIPETRNYVVFDDALIEILRKYGLAGLGIGVGAGGFGSLAPQDDNYQPPQL